MQGFLSVFFQAVYMNFLLPSCVVFAIILLLWKRKHIFMSAQKAL